MGPFGEKLQAARTARGIALEEISAKTRVSVRLLKALETEQFDLLPGGVFNISFVRQYCRLVGLDEDTTVAEFNQVARPPELTPTDEDRTVDPTVLRHERGATLAENVTEFVRRYGTATAGAFAAVVLLAVAFYLYPVSDSGVADSDAASSSEAAVSVSAPATTTQPREEPSEEQDQPLDLSRATNAPEVLEPPSTEQESAAPAPAAAAVRAADEAVESAEEAAPRQPAASFEFSTTTPFQVELSITAEVWIQAVADGERLFEDTFAPGDTRAITAQDFVRLVVGNAAGVTVVVNGTTMPPIGPSGHVRRVVLTPEGMEIDQIEPNRTPDGPSPAAETVAGPPASSQTDRSLAIANRAR